MKLLTKEIMRSLPMIGSQEDVADPVVRLKLFHPMGRFTLFVTEASAFLRNDGDSSEVSLSRLAYVNIDPMSRLVEDVRFFGWCVSALGEDCDELGYVSLRELQETKVGGLGIERDMHFTPCRLSEVMK